MYSDDSSDKIETAGLFDVKVGWNFASSLLFDVSLCEPTKAIASGLILVVIISHSNL